MFLQALSDSMALILLLVFLFGPLGISCGPRASYLTLLAEEHEGSLSVNNDVKQDSEPSVNRLRSMKSLLDAERRRTIQKSYWCTAMVSYRADLIRQ